MPRTVAYASKGRLYYGWIIVAVALLSMAFWFGFRSMFSVFLVALVEQFGWGRAAVSGVQSLAMVSYIVAAPLAGTLVDRLGPRCAILPGIILLAVGLALCATLQRLLQFYIFFGLMGGVGVAFISLAVYTAIIPHWFEKKRGTASGIAASGMGLGVMIFAPLSQGVISRWGWQMGFLSMAVLTAVVLLPLNGLLLRHKPEEMGYTGPDGRLAQMPTPGNPGKPVVPQGPQGPPQTNTAWTLRAAMGTVNFWALMAFPMLNMVAAYIVLVHFVGFLVNQGIDKMVAASAFGLLGVFNTSSRIVWGAACDRLGREKTYSLGTLLFCVSFYCLFLFQQTGATWLIYLFVVLAGVGWGSGAPVFMASTADLFHGPAIGTIYGLLEGCVGIGGAFGAFIGGFVFDLSGSYMWAFGIAVMALLLAGVLAWVAAPRNGAALKRKRLRA